MSVGATRGRIFRNPAGRRTPAVVHGIDLPTSLAGKPRDSPPQWDWRLLIGSFGGTMRESHRSHPKPYNRDPTEWRVPSPVRRHRVVDSFDPNYRRSAAGRVRADGPAAAATPLSNSMVGTGCFDSRPASWPDLSPEIPSLYTQPRRSVKDLLVFLKKEAASRTQPSFVSPRRASGALR
jgi:hypothetical protein